MRKMPNFLSVIRSKIPRHFTQVLATLAVSLGPFAAGLGKGYSSPALASLEESKTTTFHVTAQEGSWVASLSLLGALFGCLAGGMMLQLGRKMSLLIVAIPFSGSWLLTVFAQRVEMMYSTSFIGGFCSAVTLLATQVYVSEISHPEIRGCLSALLKMAGHLGTLASFALGAFLDWRQLATVAAGAPILFFLAILPIPETPSFLLYHGREAEASKSMAWLRSRGEDVASEIETLRSNIMSKEKRLMPKCSSQLTRQLFITCGLMFFHRFSGVTVFSHYAVSIFKQVYERLSEEPSLSVFGRALNPHGAAIVVVFLQLMGSMTSGLLIDTAGRLPLLTVSSLFISGGFFGFGLYNWIVESLPSTHPGFGPSVLWIPLTCVLFFSLFFSIGIGPISWLMVGELFPLEHRGFGGAVSTAFSYACAFTAVKTYVDINAHVGLHGAFWIYSLVSVAGLFFVCCIVPETRGVELEEMHHTTMPPSQPDLNITENHFQVPPSEKKLDPSILNLVNNNPSNCSLPLPLSHKMKKKGLHHIEIHIPAPASPKLISIAVANNTADVLPSQQNRYHQQHYHHQTTQLPPHQPQQYLHLNVNPNSDIAQSQPVHYHHRNIDLDYEDDDYYQYEYQPQRHSHSLYNNPHHLLEHERHASVDRQYHYHDYQHNPLISGYTHTYFPSSRPGKGTSV